ncbi:unnamed protein product [Lactuca virosa]|uniref:Uncharacterized protein n=1 Tax=Lactuca virosa TaxID=75947 RepID=A0AAU9PGI0_9ASTR|nr:unnamed protein product [Lactuca virosa]
MRSPCPIDITTTLDSDFTPSALNHPKSGSARLLPFFHREPQSVTITPTVSVLSTMTNHHSSTIAPRKCNTGTHPPSLYLCLCKNYRITSIENLNDQDSEFQDAVISRFALISVELIVAFHDFRRN